MKLILCQGKKKTNYQNINRPKGYKDAKTMDVDEGTEPNILMNIESTNTIKRKYTHIYAKHCPILIFFNMNLMTRTKADITVKPKTWKNIYKSLKEGGEFELNNYDLYTSRQKKVRGQKYGVELLKKINRINGIKFSIVKETKKHLILKKHRAKEEILLEQIKRVLL